MKWLGQIYIFTSTWFCNRQSSFITKFRVTFCHKIRRVHTVLARSKMYEEFLKKTFNILLEKDFIFRFHIYFSGNFRFFFLVSYKQSQTRAMVSFKMETQNPGANLPWKNSFRKCDVVRTIVKNLLKVTVLKRRLKKTDMEKVD